MTDRLVFAALLVALAAPAYGQHRPRPSAEFAAGALLFADDGVVTEGFAGGAARFYLTPRVSVGPELAFVGGDNHSHFIVTGNVTFDVLDSSSAAVIPFVVAGAGLFQTREEIALDSSTSSEGAFTAGGGVRMHVGSRAFVGAEVRIGWELHLRMNAIVGVRLGS